MPTIACFWSPVHADACRYLANVKWALVRETVPAQQQRVAALHALRIPGVTPKAHHLDPTSIPTVTTPRPLTAPTASIVRSVRTRGGGGAAAPTPVPFSPHRLGPSTAAANGPSARRRFAKYHLNAFATGARVLPSPRVIHVQDPSLGYPSRGSPRFGSPPRSARWYDARDTTVREVYEEIAPEYVAFADEFVEVREESLAPTSK